VENVTVRRERIDLPDGDFLDLDWGAPEENSDRLVVISHGLEGSSFQPYVQGMAAALMRRGWNVLAWSFRGCSGEPNRLPRSYHSGANDDLRAVLDHASGLKKFQQIALIGFSLGGNITLKHLGESGAQLDPNICGAVAFSVPCDLASSAAQMAKFSQRIYMRRFMKCLRMKTRQKIEAFPDTVKDHGLDEMRTFQEFDEKYTAPLHGFGGADEYWRLCSSKPTLGKISVPTLLVNALDDPFLTPQCHPKEAAEASDCFFLETPKDGGHVGFVPEKGREEYWSEERAGEFLENL